jgi:hypothetical protein
MQRGYALPGVQSLSRRRRARHDAHLAGAIGALMSGARYEIAIDGTPRTSRDTIEGAWAAATTPKTTQPTAEITVRDLQTGAVTVIKHPQAS